VASGLIGKLYVVPTPIGNLEDITLRALRVLREVDLIAAEDTRHSRTLLDRFEIRSRVVSYHQHSKRSGIDRILRSLETGDVALISDAGTPSISDPGFELIRDAVAAGHPVEVLPGASAVTTAVALAAVPAPGFLFIGFPPRARSDALRTFQNVAHLPYSLVLFESPHRVEKSLRTMLDVLGNRTVVVARELTKIHEEAIRTDLRSLLDQVAAEPPRGEWTLVVAPADSLESAPSDHEIARALADLHGAGATGRDAVEIVSDSLGVARRQVYRVWLKSSEDRI
jgi:16S rRNA (cytidine1402-2'-O)-methyltransferase